jgi:hypothetical protein
VTVGSFDKKRPCMLRRRRLVGGITFASFPLCFRVIIVRQKPEYVFTEFITRVARLQSVTSPSPNNPICHNRIPQYNKADTCVVSVRISDLPLPGAKIASVPVLFTVLVLRERMWSFIASSVQKENAIDSN